MLVLELLLPALLPALSAQDPQTPTTPPNVAVGATTPDDPAPRADVEALQAAEAYPEGTPIAALGQLARSEHAGVAARATWLISRRSGPSVRIDLADLVQSSEHVDVRVQAMHALLRGSHASSLRAALAGLDDTDMRVRTMSAQLLGKLGRADSTKPLLAMLAARGRTATAEDQSLDLQAALLALADLDAHELLSVASALDGCQANGFGPALTYLFQSQSTKMTPTDESTLMVAVLDHSESMLRRYAIGRLSGLQDLATVKALEGRLANENAELRPLVEIALTQIRRQQPIAATGGESAATSGTGVIAKLTARWNALAKNEQMIIGGLAALCVVLFFAICIAFRRSRRTRARAAATQALVAPSEAYLEESEADALAEAADDFEMEADWHEPGDPDFDAVEDEWQAEPTLQFGDPQRS